MLKKNIIFSSVISLLIVILSIFSFILIRSSKNPGYGIPTSSGSFININDNKIFVEIADTPEKTTKGLSGKKFLDGNSGMLFTFSKPDQYPSFWMKDMLIPLDFIWINDNKVVQIDKNIQPEPGVSDHNLKIYKPSIPVDYVLEVNAGYCDRYGIKVGDNTKLTITNL